VNLTIINAGQKYYIQGGSDQYQLSLSQLLQHYGHQVIPFAASNPKNKTTPWSNYFPPGIDFSNPKLLDLLQFIYSKPASLAIKRLLQEQKVDIAHLHIYYGQLTSSILIPLKKAGIPIVQTLHEYKLVCPVYTLMSNGLICQACEGNAFWQATLKRCNRGSLARSMLSTVESYVSSLIGSVSKIDHFIAVSHFQRKKLVELGIPAHKITTVHNFVNTSDSQPNNKPGKYFLYFGRLEKYKGIFTLIEAASSLKDTPLLIVGDGEARPEVEKLIMNKNLTHIHLLGFKEKEELSQLISNSICTISPSEWYETFGMCLLESFICGRPVIASRIGGMTEVVTENVDGFLITPGNVEELRERMIWMINNQHQAVAMGLMGREKVKTQFNAENHYQKIINIYQKFF
jgi:glycosyltransferase involved in cell wall biosynthesis